MIHSEMHVVVVALSEAWNVEGCSNSGAFNSDAGVWCFLCDAASGSSPVDTKRFEGALESAAVLVFDIEASFLGALVKCVLVL